MFEERVKELEFEMSFAARHPAADGWRLVRIEQSPLKALPAFLRARRHRSASDIPVCIEGDWKLATANPHAGSLDAPWRRKGIGLAAADWFGEIRLDWHGSPICAAHYQVKLLPKNSFGLAAAPSCRPCPGSGQ